MNTIEAWSFHVAAPSAPLARRQARLQAQKERHPNPMHGSVVWVEELAPGLWEVAIATRSEVRS